jgi:RNA polymerase sigma-70 factor (ECF subfamily)
MARDVVQEAFASAIRPPRRLRPEPSAEAWLWRLVVNRAISERRRAATRQTVPLSGLELDTAARNAASQGLATAVAGLPHRQRLVVFLHYYADLDYAATAKVLGISPGTVGASLHDARRSLRAALASEEVVA